jgi:hypothetical protein
MGAHNAIPPVSAAAAGARMTLHSGSVHLQAHAVANFVVAKGYVIFKNDIPEGTLEMDSERQGDAPFLELDLPIVGSGLGGDELLEVTNGVVGAALDAHCRPGEIKKSR